MFTSSHPAAGHEVEGDFGLQVLTSSDPAAKDQAESDRSAQPGFRSGVLPGHGLGILARGQGGVANAPSASLTSAEGTSWGGLPPGGKEPPTAREQGM
eukprot:10911167-Prorocentrum_lima.AAC.1